MISATKSDDGTLVALVTPVTLEVVATDADGDALTATWHLGDGTTATAALAGGRATTTKIFDTGRYVADVIVSDSHGATRSATYSPVLVETLSGRWTGLEERGKVPNATIILNLTQNGTAIDGYGEEQYVTGSILHHDPLTAFGTIVAPRVVGLRVIVAPPTGYVSPLFTASSDLRQLHTANFAGPLDDPHPLTLMRE